MSTTAADNFSTLPTEVGRAQIEYPFKKNGDRTTRIVKRTYKQLAGNFTPTALGSPDVTFSDHYLIEETDPQPTQTGLESFTRTYATIPGEQVTSSSFAFTKPSLSGTFPQAYGPYRVLQPDTTLPRYDAYGANVVVSDTGAPTFLPTGGTYKLTFDGSTFGASVNYNEAAGSVQTALNFLTPVSNRGNCVVTGSYSSGMTVTFNPYAQITIATGSLTGGTIAKTETLSNGGYTQNVAAAVAATAAAITVNQSALVTTQGTGLGIASGDADGAAYGVANSRIFYFALGSSTYFVGGTYTLTISGQTTAPIAYNANQSTIEAAINALGVGVVSLQATPPSFFWPAVARGPGLDTSLQQIAATVVWANTAPTGGTYTLTAFTQTTAAIAYNASAATVSAALAGLSGIINRGGCTVAGELYSGFSFSFSNGAISGDATSLTPAGCSITSTNGDGTTGRVQVVRFASTSATRVLYILNHGISVGDVLYVKGGSTYYGDVTNFTVSDANTISMTISPLNAYASASTITEAGKRYKAGYEPGTKTTRCVRTTTHSFPGVSAGIATADDIPIPQSQSDGPSLILAIFGGTGTLNIGVGELTRWRDGPIWAMTTTTINAADV
jgi:hypothetical protein